MTDRPTREDALLQRLKDDFAEFEAAPINVGLDFTKKKDAWGVDMYLHSHVWARFCGWLAHRDHGPAIVIDRDKVPLTDELLGSMGFKWSQEERQPEKHWSLSLGWGAQNTRACMDDLCIEVAGGAMDGEWFCWLRRGNRFSDRFIHVRHIKYQHELEEIITALTGTKWKRENSMYGNFYNDEMTEKMRPEYERISAALLAEKVEG